MTKQNSVSESGKRSGNSRQQTLEELKDFEQTAARAATNSLSVAQVSSRAEQLVQNVSENPPTRKRNAKGQRKRGRDQAAAASVAQESSSMAQAPPAKFRRLAAVFRNTMRSFRLVCAHYLSKEEVRVEVSEALVQLDFIHDYKKMWYMGKQIDELIHCVEQLLGLADFARSEQLSDVLYVTYLVQQLPVNPNDRPPYVALENPEYLFTEYGTQLNEDRLGLIRDLNLNLDNVQDGPVIHVGPVQQPNVIQAQVINGVPRIPVPQPNAIQAQVVNVVPGVQDQIVNIDLTETEVDDNDLYADEQLGNQHDSSIEFVENVPENVSNVRPWSVNQLLGSSRFQSRLKKEGGYQRFCRELEDQIQYINQQVQNGENSDLLMLSPGFVDVVLACAVENYGGDAHNHVQVWNWAQFQRTALSVRNLGVQAIQANLTELLVDVPLVFPFRLKGVFYCGLITKIQDVVYALRIWRGEDDGFNPVYVDQTLRKLASHIYTIDPSEVEVRYVSAAVAEDHDSALETLSFIARAIKDVKKFSLCLKHGFTREIRFDVNKSVELRRNLFLMLNQMQEGQDYRHIAQVFRVYVDDIVPI